MELRVVDSHTEGEPTRLVVEGLPDLPGSVHDRRDALRDRFDWVRRMVCLEPRGSEIAIGAVTLEPSRPDCLADVVFFNNTGYLGMCGHGTIGILETLRWLGKVAPGEYRLNTVAGTVVARILAEHRVSFDNVPSHRRSKAVRVEVPVHGPVVGDIAYGGNWFFLVESPKVEVAPDRIPRLMDFTSAVMDALWEQGITGDDGARIDHVEVYGPPTRADADSKNFVLCPGKQYDRSPCGTGTSAKLASLFEDGRIGEGEVWRQESIVGSLFKGSVKSVEGRIVPTIEGTAYVTGDCRLIAEESDPFRHGLSLSESGS